MGTNNHGITYRYVCSECGEDVLEESPDYHRSHDCPYCFHKLNSPITIPDAVGLLAGRAPIRGGLVGVID